MAYALGIDLGTTYTAAAAARGDQVEIVPLGNRAATIPTLVYFGEDGSFRVGEAALGRAITSPERVAREFKRRLGDPTPLVLAGTAWSAEALMGEVLRRVVDIVTEREGGPPDRIALTHPANWGPYKLDLLTQAVRMAGLKVDHYLTEPEAAAFAYAYNAAQRVPVGSVVAVYDLGGGTFDATVLRTTSTGFEILGNPEGIERLGGIDVDEMVFAHVRAALGDALEGLDPADPAATSLLARLRADCVVAKEQLSNDTEVSVPVTLPGIQTEVRMTRAELEAVIAGPIDQSVAALRRALVSSGVEAEEIHAVLLVGGSSRIPIVADMVGRALGRPVAVDVHPKHGVAIGAALAARGASASRTEAAPVAHVPDAPTLATPTPAAPMPAQPRTQSYDIMPRQAAASPAAVKTAPDPTTVPAEWVAMAQPQPAPVVQPQQVHATGGVNRALVGGLVALALVVAGLGGIVFGRGNGGTSAITAPAGAVPPTGTVSCPSNDPAVCIQTVSIANGQLVANFAPRQVALAAPVDGSFAAGTVHPLFFFDIEGPEKGREWGPKSPFTGTNAAGFEGYRAADIPKGANLCVILLDANRQWIPGTGNCVPPPV